MWMSYDRLVGRPGERLLPLEPNWDLSTHRSRRRICRRTTCLPWTLTFDQATAKAALGDSGCSRAPTDDPDELGLERLHPMVMNWSCRPKAEVVVQRFIARSGRRAAGALESSAPAPTGAPTRGFTWPTRYAAVRAMRHAPRDGLQRCALAAKGEEVVVATVAAPPQSRAHLPAVARQRGARDIGALTLRALNLVGLIYYAESAD